MAMILPQEPSYYHNYYYFPSLGDVHKILLLGETASSALVERWYFWELSFIYVYLI